MRTPYLQVHQREVPVEIDGRKYFIKVVEEDDAAESVEVGEFLNRSGPVSSNLVDGRGIDWWSRSSRWDLPTVVMAYLRQETVYLPSKWEFFNLGTLPTNSRHAT